MAKIPSTKIRESTGDAILNILTGVVLVLLILVVGYPVIYVISCSFSDPAALQAGKVVLWPVDPCLNAYEFVLQYKQVWTGFRMSVFYTRYRFMAILITPLPRYFHSGASIYALASLTHMSRNSALNECLYH